MLHRYRGAVGDLAKPVAKPDPITPCQSAPQRAHAKLRRLPISARHPHACGRGRVLLCGFFCLHNRKPPSPQRAHALIHASRTGYSAERAPIIIRITCASQLYLRTPCSAPPPFFSRTACAPALRPTPNSPIHPSSSPFLTVGVRSIETSWDGARQIPWLCSPPFPPLHIPAPLALYAHTWFRAPRLCGYNPNSTLRASSISPSPLQLKQ